MLFSEELRNETNSIFDGINHHPFVAGIGNGEVPREALIHYVKADFEYLSAFIRIYGLAIAKCENREDMAFFHKQIDFVLNSEIHAHNNFCEVAGVNYDDLQGSALPPTADHYVSHMMEAAQQGSMGELIAALLPCPWTYLEIGKHLVETKEPEASHPFYEWIMFYAKDETAQITHELQRRLDDWAEQAGPLDKEKAKIAFKKSCQLEYNFWEMAYTQEEWPF